LGNIRFILFAKVTSWSSEWPTRLVRFLPTG
jgi:hypothetical protein